MAPPDPGAPRSIPADTPRALIIDGRPVAGAAGPFEVTNPADDSVLASVAEADPAQGLAALDAAVRAQDAWRRTAARERAELLRAAFEEVTRRGEDFARLMTLETGKPLAESRGADPRSPAPTGTGAGCPPQRPAPRLGGAPCAPRRTEGAASSPVGRTAAAARRPRWAPRWRPRVLLRRVPSPSRAPAGTGRQFDQSTIGALTT